METSKTFLAISCVMVVFVVGVVYSQQQGMRPRVFTKENHVMPKNAEEQNITRPLRIVVETLEGGDRQQQTVLETALRSQTKVESREKLLEPVLKHPDLRLAGWHQRICEVKQVAGVTTVTVCVQPIMEVGGHICKRRCTCRGNLRTQRHVIETRFLEASRKLD